MPESQNSDVEHSSGPGPPANNPDWGKLDALLESLPPGIPLLPPEDAGNFSKYTHKPPHDYVPGDGWKNCARALERYDAELCKGYREEIDTLLVFAGLFSAVVTAFTIESYQWLQSDHNDAMIVLLWHIAQSVSPNSTDSPLPAASTGLPSPVSVRINIYWFLALTLSLTAALVSILCKQWVREFERNVGLDAIQFLSIHQTKLEGLENWRVGGVIALLPLLLQLALALFALGVLELLWQLHSTIAALVCVPTVAALLFYLGTTILPVIQYQVLESHLRLSFWHKLSQCPYRSPQAMLAVRIFALCLWIRSILSGAISYLVHSITVARYCLMVSLRLSEPSPFPVFMGVPMRLRLYPRSWNALDINHLLDVADHLVERPRPLSLYRSLHWIHTHLNDGDLNEWIWRCLWEVADRDRFWFGWGENSVKQGLYYVYSDYVASGATDTPRGGPHAIALGYLSRAPVPHMFVVEACIQNLMSMDSGSADYLAEHMSIGLSHRLDPPAAVAIVRAFSDMRDCTFGSRSDRLLPTLSVYLNWLGAQPIPYQPATVEATRDMIHHCISSLGDAGDDFVAHPEHLRRRHDVHELAELVRIFAHSHEDPVLALAAAIYAGEEEKLRPIVNELLDIARHGGGPEACDAAATSSAEPSPRVSRAPGSRYEVRGSEEPLERSAPDEETSAGARRDRTRRAEPHVGLAAPATEHDDVTRGSAPTESPALGAVIIHERPSDVAALQPDGHRGAAAPVRSTDGDDDQDSARKLDAGAPGSASLV